MKKNLLILMALLASSLTIAQEIRHDSASSLIMFHGNLGFHVPGGAMAERFGNSFLAGAGFLYKTDKNWLWGMEADLIFGNDVKEDGLFEAIQTETGFLINASGLYADVILYERGFLIGPKVGRVIPLNPAKPDRGLMFTLSPGLMQHKIRIIDEGNATPPLDEPYLKGYDRLTNGMALTGFLGYFFTSERRLTSFFAGVEAVHGWTMSRRDWDFDRMSKDTEHRSDLLTGIKVGWIIQLGGGRPDKIYYY